MLKRLWSKLPFTPMPCQPRPGADMDLSDAYLMHQQFQVDDLLERPLQETRFVVIDTETTGMHPYAGDEVISIGMLELRGTQPTGREYAQLINPQRPIAETASEVHGIDDEHVADAPTLGYCLPSILRFIDNAVIVGHHVDFDMRFLNKHIQHSLGCAMRNARLDTMALYLEFTGRRGAYSLERVAKDCEITITERHTALGDARACAAIFGFLAAKLSAPQAPAQHLVRLHDDQRRALQRDK